MAPESDRSLALRRDLADLQRHRRPGLVGLRRKHHPEEEAQEGKGFRLAVQVPTPAARLHAALREVRSGTQGVIHGAPEPVDPAVFFGPDPHLALVTANLGDWLRAHPCPCDGLTCICLDGEASE